MKLVGGWQNVLMIAPFRARSGQQLLPGLWEYDRSRNWSVCCSSDDTSPEAVEEDVDIPDSAKNAIIIGLKRYEAGA